MVALLALLALLPLQFEFETEKEGGGNPYQVLNLVRDTATLT